MLSVTIGCTGGAVSGWGCSVIAPTQHMMLQTMQTPSFILRRATYDMNSLANDVQLSPQSLARTDGGTPAEDRIWPRAGTNSSAGNLGQIYFCMIFRHVDLD